MKNFHSSPINSEMENRLVAYVDILGSSRAILCGDEDQKNIAISLIKYLYHFAPERENLAKIREKRPDSISFEVAAFSDSLIISSPPIYSHEDYSQYFSELTFRIAVWQSEILERGFLSRGGIACGKILHKNSLIVGEAICKAAALEKAAKAAKIPAVILEDGLFERLIESQKLIHKKVFPGQEFNSNRFMPDGRVDKENDYYFVNYLKINHNRRNYFENITRVILSNLRSAESDQSIKSKWSWAATKFNENVKSEKSSFYSPTLEIFPELEEIKVGK